MALTVWDRIQHPMQSFSGCLVVRPVFSSLLMSPCIYIMALPESSSSFLATAVSLSTYSWICFYFSSWLKQCVLRVFTDTSFCFHYELGNPSSAHTLSNSIPVWPSFTSSHWVVEDFCDSPYLAAISGIIFCFRALNDVLCIDFDIGRDVGHCKIWTTWMHAASCISMLERLLNMNEAKSAF
jgi:hypothetical protein